MVWYGNLVIDELLTKLLDFSLKARVNEGGSEAASQAVVKLGRGLGFNISVFNPDTLCFSHFIKLLYCKKNDGRVKLTFICEVAKIFFLSYVIN